MFFLPPRRMIDTGLELGAAPGPSDAGERSRFYQVTMINPFIARWSDGVVNVG